MYEYMVWALVQHNRKRAFIRAASSLEARKAYATAHNIPLLDCKARRTGA